jgi:predicted phage terminase large subunit-like protein
VPTRFRDHTSSARFCIMQRLHVKDLAAEMIRSGATVLCLPMEFEPEHPHRWARDPRTAPGELLLPERVPASELPRLKIVMGPTRTAAQLQQRPVAAGGKVFKAEWFQRWTELPPGGTWAVSVDCAFKSTDDSSFVVIQVWYQHGPNFYLVDQHRERMDFTATLAAILAMCVRYPHAFLKLIEDKANGTAVVNVLETKLPGLALVEPQGGKETRANAVQPLVSSLNVFVPHPTNARYDDGRRGAPWVESYGEGDPTEGGFLGEVTTFPNAATDDATDAMTQYLNHAGASSLGQLEAAMNAIFDRK